jgi:GNAT superfamily N-acetyltransferase
VTTTEGCVPRPAEGPAEYPATRPADDATVRPAVRPPRERDVEQIHAVVGELAAFEREPDAVTATVEDFRTALFGPEPRVYCLVAESDQPSELAGMALWYESFSTWQGRHGLWLEDLFVRPQHRGTGLGRLLLERLAAICVEQEYRRLEWNVLDWNELTLGFYRRIGARALDGWTVHRLTGDALHRLASANQGEGHTGVWIADVDDRPQDDRPTAAAQDDRPTAAGRLEPAEPFESTRPTT